MEGDKVREIPVTFEDHYSQATLFVRSLSDVERQHLVSAYTFELSKCYEETIRVRQLQCLANIDTELCAEVARGLGLPAPEPTQPPVDAPASAALSQIGRQWPVTGRKIALVVDSDTPEEAITAAKNAVVDAGMLPFVTAPTGGKVGGVVVDRTFLTAASIEFDAALILQAPAPAPDATPTFDAKAGQDTAGKAVDPRMVKMIAEMFRHCKAIAVTPEADAILTAAGVPKDAAGVVVGEPATAVAQLAELLASHRVWERFA